MKYKKKYLNLKIQKGGLDEIGMIHNMLTNYIKLVTDFVEEPNLQYDPQNEYNIKSFETKYMSDYNKIYPYLSERIKNLLESVTFLIGDDKDVELNNYKVNIKFIDKYLNLINTAFIQYLDSRSIANNSSQLSYSKRIIDIEKNVNILYDNIFRLRWLMQNFNTPAFRKLLKNKCNENVNCPDVANDCRQYRGYTKFKQIYEDLIYYISRRVNISSGKPTDYTCANCRNIFCGPYEDVMNFGEHEEDQRVQEEKEEKLQQKKEKQLKKVEDELKQLKNAPVYMKKRYLEDENRLKSQLVRNPVPRTGTFTIAKEGPVQNSDGNYVFRYYSINGDVVDEVSAYPQK